MKSCNFYCKRHILAWIHVDWAILREGLLGGFWPLDSRSKKSQKVTWGSHRNDMLPLTHGLHYRAAVIWWMISHKFASWKHIYPQIIPVRKSKMVAGAIFKFDVTRLLWLIFGWHFAQWITWYSTSKIYFAQNPRWRCRLFDIWFNDCNTATVDTGTEVGFGTVMSRKQ